MSKQLPIIVAEIEKNSRDRIRVTLEVYRGTTVVNVRVFYQDEKNGTWKPGSQGIAMDVKKLPELSKAIVKARKEALAVGLI